MHVDPSCPATLSVRPEDVVVSDDLKAGQLRGEVLFMRDLGPSVEILVQVGDMEITSVCTPMLRPNVKLGDQVGVEILTGRATVLAS